MKIVIIPGFTGYPEEKTFLELGETLTSMGHNVIKIAWPNLPDNLDKYNFTNTIEHASKVIEGLDKQDELIILGFSMGGVIATVLANKYNPIKLGLIVSPYQAGSEDDLAGKYIEWKQIGLRELISSRFGKLVMPFSFIEDAQKYNALDIISNIKCPKIFIAGEEDTKVPLGVSKKLFDIAIEPKEWHQIPGMEHKYQYQPDMLKQVNDLLLAFIEG
jgi:esterase/lipase